MRCTCGVFVVAMLSGVQAVGAPPQFHAVVAGDQPSLWYRFDEAPGSAAIVNYGSLGSAFNATARNGAFVGAASASGDTSILFNAQLQQYVDSSAAAPAAFLGNPTFTAEAIVFVNDNGNQANVGYPPFLHWGAPATGQSVYFSLQNRSDDRAYVGFYNGGLRTVCTIAPGNWNHYVWVRQGGQTQWTGSTLYVNGQPVALEQDTVLIGAPNINVTSTTFTIQRATDFSRYFSGRVDEIALYPRALSAAEVLEHFQASGLSRCLGDVDDGSGTGTPDGGVAIEDLLYYLALFAGGSACADIDDGSGSGTRDLGVGIEDLLYYLERFAAGC